jgi:hypothetical protein
MAAEVQAARSIPLSQSVAFTCGVFGAGRHAELPVRRRVRVRVQSYLEFSAADVDSLSPEEIILFSGGLDSFAGSIEELVANGKSIALVSHRSATKMASAQTRLIDELRKRVSANRIHLGQP